MFEAILRAIDEEIEKLEKAKALLTSPLAAPIRRGPGRPKKVSGAAKSSKKTASKRTMSTEARERISQAQIKRWAKSRRAA